MRFRRGGERASRPVSRVLSPPLCSRPLRAAAPRRRGTAIHLRRRLPGACSGPTRDMGRATLNGEPSVPVRPCSGRGLPGRPVTRPPVGSYPTISPLPRQRRGCVISVALSFGSPRLGVTQRPALWSPDFPRTTSARGRPAGLPADSTAAWTASPFPTAPHGLPGCSVAHIRTVIGSIRPAHLFALTR
jgi:hypothetical protein